MNVMPENWILTSLQEITKYIQRGISPKYVDSDGVPVVNQKAIRWDGIKEEFLKYLDRDQFSKVSEERHLKLGDVLINSTGTGTIGRACILDKKELSKARVVDSHVTIIRGDANAVIPKYMYYWMRSRQVQETLDGLYTGTTNQIELTRNVLLNLEIPLPPLPEQKRIVAKLDNLFAHLDQLKARLQNIPTLLKQFRQAVLTQAVTGKLTEELRSNNVAEWKREKTIDCCLVVQSGGTPREGFSKDGIPFLKVYNIVNQNIDFNYKPQFITKEIHTKGQKKSITIPGDVLMNIVGPPLGKIAIVTDDYKEWNINQAITLFRTKNYLLNKYLYYYFCEGTIIRDIINETRGVVGQSNISLSQCRNFEIDIPPIEEQKEIVRRVESLFTVADRIEASYTKLQEKIEGLPQAILSKAFRGELVSGYAEIEGEVHSIAAETANAFELKLADGSV